MAPESDDWLAPEPEQKVGLPAVVALPDDYKGRLALVETCWSRLTEKQKIFLQAWRDCRFNASAAARQLGLSSSTKPMTKWMEESDFATVVRVWQANAAATALDRDRLLARHDDIVETLLEPKIVVTRDGNVVPTPGDANGAARANETLMQAAGILKSGGKDVEVNVGVTVGIPTLSIQVMPMPPSKAAKADNVVIDAKFTELPSGGD